jgi:hypothetical protein
MCPTAGAEPAGALTPSSLLSSAAPVTLYEDSAAAPGPLALKIWGGPVFGADSGRRTRVRWAVRVPRPQPHLPVATDVRVANIMQAGGGAAEAAAVAQVGELPPVALECSATVRARLVFILWTTWCRVSRLSYCLCVSSSVG